MNDKSIGMGKGVVVVSLIYSSEIYLEGFCKTTKVCEGGGMVSSAESFQTVKHKFLQHASYRTMAYGLTI
jgi:hypothetical protein